MLLGVLMVLLTPCIDCVIVFSGLAGGAHQRLLAAAPLLMLAQMVALPSLLVLFMGPGLTDIVEMVPEIEDQLGAVVSVLPLYAAFLVIMAGLGLLLARMFRLDVPSSRALIFSGAPATPSSCFPWPSPCPRPTPSHRSSSSPRPWSS